MDKELLEKSISGLSPELQEKARACQSMNELLELIAENDVELSDDALEAVAGGCSKSSSYYNQGDPVTKHKRATCPLCSQQLYYWDMCSGKKGHDCITRMYVNNPSCSSYNNGLWYVKAYTSGIIDENATVQKY